MRYWTIEYKMNGSEKVEMEWVFNEQDKNKFVKKLAKYGAKLLSINEENAMIVARNGEFLDVPECE